MTLIVEDGSIVANANSYVTTDELNTYATARGVTIASGVREQWLVMAMDYLEQLSFKGIKYTQGQSLQWPRVNVTIDTYLVDSDEIPALLQNAQMQLAMSFYAGYSPINVHERAIKSADVGSLRVEYMDNASTNNIDPKVTFFLNKLLDGGVGGNTIRVNKA